MEKDDLGVEMDDEVAVFLKDPKSTLFTKVLDYKERRKKKEAEIEAEKKKKENPEREKLFGMF